MVASFLDLNKQKTSLKKWIRTVSNFIVLVQFHSICQMMAKFSGVQSERTVSKFRKRKTKFNCCLVFTYSIKRAREIRNFTSQSHSDAEKYTENRNARVKLLFFLFKPLAFLPFSLPSPSSCLSSLLLWSRNFATMVTWRHNSPVYKETINC